MLGHRSAADAEQLPAVQLNREVLRFSTDCHRLLDIRGKHGFVVALDEFAVIRDSLIHRGRNVRSSLHDWVFDADVRDRCAEYSQRPCGDCHAVKGQYHCDNCDMELCPRCFTQLLSCGCGYDVGDRNDKSLLFG